MRIDELKQLSDGLLDGDGFALSHTGLDWLHGMLNRCDPPLCPPPDLFPTTQGGVFVEWDLEVWDPSLDIDLEKRTGSWHVLNHNTNEEETAELDLGTDEIWTWIARRIQEMLLDGG